MTAPALLLELDLDGLVEAVAERLAEMLVEDRRSPWLRAEEAAEHLRCPLSRVRKMTAAGELPHHRDGGRVLYRRDELDRYVAG